MSAFVGGRQRHNRHALGVRLLSKTARSRPREAPLPFMGWKARHGSQDGLCVKAWADVPSASRLPVPRRIG